MVTTLLRRARRAEPRQWVVVVLVAACAVSSTVFAVTTMGDYTFFVDITRLVRQGAGLHIYAESPNIQSGPIHLAAIMVIAAIGTAAFPVAVGIAGAASLVAVGRLDGARRRHPVVLLVGGLVTVVWWRAYAFHGHLDDALVAMLAVFSLLRVQQGKRWDAAVLIGLALATKPWAVFLVPMTIRAGEGRRTVRFPAASVAVGALLWSPFVVADPGSLSGLRPTLRLAPDSVLHLLTGDRFVAGSAALRVAQLLVATLAVAWVSWRGRPALALLVGVSLRMMLDLGTWPYYSVALVLGALVVDLEESDRPLPWATLAATALLPVPTADWVHVPEIKALLRFVACSGALVFAAWATTGARRPSAEGGRSRACGPEEVLVELDAEPGCVRQLEPAVDRA